MKTIFNLIFIAAFILSATVKSIAQNLTDGSKMYLLKPNNKSIGVAIGSSPEDFKKIFGNPTSTSSRYYEFAGETIQSFHYNKCVIDFIKADGQKHYHLQSFDLQDATIGFGEKDVYVITIGQTVVDTPYPKGHPMFGRGIFTRSINGVNFKDYLKYKGSDVKNVYVYEALFHGNSLTDASLSMIFSGLTLRRIILQYAFD